MASFVNYTANGTTDVFTVAFEYLVKSHVKVFVNAVEDTTFTWDTDSAIKLSAMPNNGDTIAIRRETPRSALIVTIPNSGTFRGRDINNQSKQAIFAAEEAFDNLGNSMALDTTDNTFNANSRRIKNVANPVNAQDAVTKNWAETAMSSQLASATAQATAAAASASTASSAASAASASQTAAASSASAAASSASTASTQATNAANSASAAATSATNAANSATTASGHASAAGSSASAASTSASAASTSATNAANSASAAASSATAAAASFDSFDDRYLGSKTSDPTLDNDGNALLTGALYWNSVANNLRIWSGSAWVVFSLYAHPNHTGDVTSVADGATTIAADAVTNAKLANVATKTIKGRTTAGTGDPEDLTVAQARSVLGLQISHPGGRLTNLTGTPCPTNTMAATTIYYTPYLHNYVPIYDGSNFHMTDIGSERSQLLSDNTKSPTAAAANRNYDMFVWNDGGTIRCTRGPAWSSDIARGTGAGTTELERINGVWVNKIAITNGPAAQRGTYVGTIRTNASSLVDYRLFARGTGADQKLHVCVWNMYNRVRIETTSMLSTASWTCNSPTWRARNAETANARLDFVSGMADDCLYASRYTTALNAATASNNRAYVGIGLDSTTASGFGYTPTQAGALITAVASTFTQIVPQLGFHYIAALEFAENANTVTFYNDGPQFAVGWMA